MATISILMHQDIFKTGLPDFVIFHPKFKSESFGLKGRNDKNFRLLTVEGQVRLTNGLVEIKVDWLEKGSFSFPQSLAYEIHVDHKFVWRNPAWCPDCLELCGEIIKGEDKMMRCKQGHCWEVKNLI